MVIVLANFLGVIVFDFDIDDSIYCFLYFIPLWYLDIFGSLFKLEFISFKFNLGIYGLHSFIIC